MLTIKQIKEWEDKNWEGFGGVRATKAVFENKQICCMTHGRSQDLQRSGWFFVTRDEGTAYMAEPENWVTCSITDMIDIDKSVIPYLDAPYGMLYERETPSDEFVDTTLAGLAEGCIATKDLVDNKKKVRWMYREESDLKYLSGWHFFSGDEDQEYVDDLNNSAIYHLRTIMDIDPDIIEYWHSPYDSVFEREDPNADFVVSDFNFEIDES